MRRDKGMRQAFHYWSPERCLAQSETAIVVFSSRQIRGIREHFNRCPRGLRTRRGYREQVGIYCKSIKSRSINVEEVEGVICTYFRSRIRSADRQRICSLSSISFQGQEVRSQGLH